MSDDVKNRHEIFRSNVITGIGFTGHIISSINVEVLYQAFRERLKQDIIQSNFEQLEMLAEKK